MNTYPNSNYYAQMHHAAVEAAEPFDMEDEARRNPFAAAVVAQCEADAERRKREAEKEKEEEE